MGKSKTRIGWLFAVACLLPSLVMGAGKSGEIWAEGKLADSRVLVRQAVVFTVSIFSPNNLKTVDVHLPRVDGIIFEKLDGPKARHEVRNRKRYIVNEFRYLVTPLRAGTVEIPPITLDASSALPQAAGGYPYSGYSPWQPSPSARNGQPQRMSTSTNRTRLDVEALPAQAKSLLPVQDLRIEGGIQGAAAAQVGEPLTLTVVVRGLGITGERLPSVAEQLDSRFFKVYPEQPRTEHYVDERLDLVVGRRMETFTLIPTRSGAVEVPLIEVPWWNPLSGRIETARLAVPVVNVGGTGGSRSAPMAASRAAAAGRGGSGVPLHIEGEDVRRFWLPVGGGLLLAFVFGWWWGRGHSLAGWQEAAQQGRRWLQPVAQEAGEKVVRGMELVSRRTGLRLPARVRGAFAGLGDRLLGGVGRILPRRAKIWLCMRRVRREQQPTGMCRILRHFAHECLGVPENSSLQRIACALAKERPPGEESAYLNLFGQLDQALYDEGAGRFDLAAWKREFNRLFRRLLLGTRSWWRGVRGQGLPQLNPH